MKKIQILYRTHGSGLCGFVMVLCLLLSVLCIHYMTLLSLKLFIGFQELLLWKTDGEQDPNLSFLFQTLWLCYYKVCNCVLAVFLSKWLLYGPKTQLTNIKLIMALRKH